MFSILILCSPLEDEIREIKITYTEILRDRRLVEANKKSLDGS